MVIAEMKIPTQPCLQPTSLLSEVHGANGQDSLLSRYGQKRSAAETLIRMQLRAINIISIVFIGMQREPNWRAGYLARLLRAGRYTKQSCRSR